MNRILSGILVMGLLLIQPSLSFACSCKPPSTIEKSFEQYDAVFVGRVLARRRDSKGPVYGVQVQEVYKGSAAGEIVSIRSAPGGGQCGIDAMRGSQWLWYLSGEGKQFSVSLCSRTKELTSAYKEIRRLRTLSADAKATTKDSETKGSKERSVESTTASPQ